MFKLNEIFSFIQIALIAVKVFGGFPNTNWFVIFFPAYIMIILEYFKMFKSKSAKIPHAEQYGQKIKMPVKNNNGALFYLLVNPILEKHGVMQDYSIVFFNEVYGKPELFEYVGNIDVVRKLAQDTKYVKYLCDERKEFFKELVEYKGASINTMIGVLLDNKAMAIGLVAFWDNSQTPLTTNGNLRIEFTQLPIGVIYD